MKKGCGVFKEEALNLNSVYCYPHRAERNAFPREARERIDRLSEKNEKCKIDYPRQLFTMGRSFR